MPAHRGLSALHFWRDRLFSMNDTSQEDDPAGQNCTLFGAGWHKTKRPGLGLSHKALSRSALPRVLLNHRIEPQLFRVNGTEVPDDITLRPYRYNPPLLNLYPLAAGHFRER